MAKKNTRKTSAYKNLPLASPQLVNRLGQITVITLVAAIFVLGQGGNSAVNKWKMAAHDALVPVLSVAAAPFDAVSNGVKFFQNWALVHGQNAQLKQENAELMRWQAMAKEMQAENASLRSLLHVVESRKMRFTTAQIVSDAGGAFTHSALLNAGEAAGIKPNQAVVNERGLVGRVVETGKNSARVLLLSDMNSRVPVMNERTREKMILTGGNDALPTLAYMQTGSPTKAGDRVITSGDGGIFPKGIAVGLVREGEANKMRVEPFAAPSQAEYVSVVE